MEIKKLTDKEEKLLSDMFNTVVELNYNTVICRKITHNKEFIDSVNIFEGELIANLININFKYVILLISHLLDTENNNVSFKNIIKKDSHLINKFNKEFCDISELMFPENKDKQEKATFKYKYKEDIRKILTYRNKTIGHKAVNFELSSKNNFLYSDIYNLVKKITLFFQEIGLHIKDCHYEIDSYNDFKEKYISKEMKNIIIAGELFNEYKQKDLLEIKNSYRKAFTGNK